MKIKKKEAVNGPILNKKRGQEVPIFKMVWMYSQILKRGKLSNGLGNFREKIALKIPFKK